MTDRGSTPAFEDIWSELGLADAPRGLALDATINPRTLAAIAGRASQSDEDAAQTLPMAAHEAVPVTLHTLPHISFALPAGAVPALPRDGASQPDLEPVGVLGEGGMGRVHLARQRSLSRHVAVKVLKREVNDPGLMHALLAEATVTGSLEHPNIVPVHALGLGDGGRPILVMKHVEGVSWRELLRDPAHPAWKTLGAADDDRLAAHLGILMHVCNAVEFAHRRGIVHRDIKPANVMVGEFGEVYLMDWGIAARSGAWAEASDRSADGAAEPPARMLGTPAYMAPEMLTRRYGPIDELTDVYLLGATLHEVLTGHPRHRGGSLYEVLFEACTSEPYAYDATVPAELGAVCNKATSVQRAGRHPSAQAFRQAIAEFLRHRSSIALSDAAERRLVELDAALGAADAERAYRLMTECRFGFLHALRGWKDNPAAKRGLERSLEAMIEHEIAQSNAVAARSLLGELPSPRADLEARVGELDEVLRRRREQEGLLQRMTQDLDLSAAARERTRVWAALVLVGIALMGFTIQQVHATGELTHRVSVFIAGAALGCFGVTLWIGRRRLLHNAANQRLVIMASLCVVGCFALHLLSMLQGTRAVAVLPTDMVLIAVILGVGSSLLPWLRWLAGVHLAGAFLCAALPGLTLPVFGVIVVGTLAVAAASARQKHVAR